MSAKATARGTKRGAEQGGGLVADPSPPGPAGAAATAKRPGTRAKTAAKSAASARATAPAAPPPAKSASAPAAAPGPRVRRKFDAPADGFDPFAAGSNVGDYLGGLDPSGEAPKPDTHVPLTAIRPFPGQPRRHFDPAAVEELAASIEREGLINPLTVRPAPSGDGYELLAGERRYRALSLLAARAATPGMAVPVTVKAVGDLQARAITARENQDREDLWKWETALAYRNVAEVLREERGGDPGYEVLADYIGRAIGVVHEYMTIAGRLDEATLARAGFTDADGRPDYGRIARLSKSVLLKAAKAASDETRVAVLAREAERLRNAGADGAPAPARRKAGALDSQRTLADRYYEEGGFRINLPGALKKVSPQDAAKYLDAMLPAVSGLVDRAMADDPGHVFARPAGRGYVVYVPTLDGEHPDPIVRAAAAWLAAHAEGEFPGSNGRPSAGHAG